MTKNVLDMTTGLQVFTAETGLNTNALQQWQQAAKEVGLGAELATNSIMRVSQLVAGMRTGHGDIGAMSAMAALGVRDISGSAYDVMNRIQAAAASKSPAVSADLLSRMGISPEMMRVFSIPQAERERIKPILGGGDQAQLAQFTKELAMFNQQVLGQFTKVLVEFEPYMAAFTEVMAAAIGKAGGIAGYSIGETSKLFQAIMHEGGIGNFLENIEHSWETPEDLKSQRMRNFNGETTVNINVHGVNDPNAVADAIDRHHKRAMTNAHKMFNKQGNP